MTQEDEARRLFEAALGQPIEERLAWLRQAIADPWLIARVTALLSSHEQAGRFIGGEGVTGPLGTPSDSSSMPPFERLDEFELIRELGRGGMGVVYLARDTLLDRMVAIKVLPALVAFTPPHVERLRTEATVMARLSHASIVPIFRLGSAGETQYIASEYVDGSDLARELERRKAEGLPPWSGQDAAQMLASIADALHHAHQKGVIHRDVKPSNIMLDRKGRAYLTDFGLAKIIGDVTLTRTGDLAGTCAYMSPEQAAAQRAVVDHRTDVFSLGIVLYEMVSGARPFIGETREQILHAIGSARPVPLRQVVADVSTDLESICERALEKLPEDRYASAAAFAADLRRFGVGEPIHARPPDVWRRARRWVRAHRKPLIGSVTAALAVAAGVHLGRRAGADPRVEVTFVSNPMGAKVVAMSFVPATGEYVESLDVGRTPTRRRLSPGMYRFVFASGNDVAELSRTVHRSNGAAPGLSVNATLRPAGQVTERMIRIAGGAFFTGMRPAQGTHADGDSASPSLPPPYAYAPARVGDFFIDRFEVTNAEYAAFVKATGRPLPPAWARPHELAGWDRMPVVGVTWLDARDYAEWAGKRLPTRAEWERVGRGLNGARYPWPDSLSLSVSELLARACIGRATPQKDGEAPDWFALYCSNVPPIGSFPIDRTQDGVSDLVGSVAEWVDTPDMRFVNGELVVVEHARWAKGGSWRTAVPYADLETILQVPEDEPLADQSIGFRCACSVAR